MKKTLISIVGILAVAACAVASFSQQVPARNQDSNESLPITATLTTPNQQQIHVRIADDDRKRELGLSYFKELPADQGMLFLFDQPGVYPFWMKGMNFPLDIIWLKKAPQNSFEVVFVAESVDPATYPRIIDPNTEADAVLEINANSATRSGVAVGGVIKQ